MHKVHTGLIHSSKWETGKRIGPSISEEKMNENKTKLRTTVCKTRQRRLVHGHEDLYFCRRGDSRERHSQGRVFGVLPAELSLPHADDLLVAEHAHLIRGQRVVTQHCLVVVTQVGEIRLMGEQQNIRLVRQNKGANMKLNLGTTFADIVIVTRNTPSQGLRKNKQINK